MTGAHAGMLLRGGDVTIYIYMFMYIYTYIWQKGSVLQEHMLGGSITELMSLYIYICICLYIYIYIYIYTYMYIYICIYIYIYCKVPGNKAQQLCERTFYFTCNIHVYICIYICMHTYMYIYIYVCMYLYIVKYLGTERSNVTDEVSFQVITHVNESWHTYESRHT